MNPGKESADGRFTFNFHYVSINSYLSWCLRYIVHFFKFHYVSINSHITLNAIPVSSGFKFHYVSINSYSYDVALSYVPFFKFHYVSINSKLKSILTGEQAALNSIMFLLIPVPKPTAYLLHETPLFCRPLQNISFLSHSSSYVLVTPPILAIFYFCRFPAFFTLSQVDRNHYIFIISSFLLA